MIGFNNHNEIESFRMISEATQIIKKGHGTHTFNVDAIAKDWGDEGDFKVYVNLSEHPHPSTWKPLASDNKILVFN
jgi:hypothetical protein